MVDFLSQLVRRTQGSGATIQPYIAPQFAPEPSIGATSPTETSPEAAGPQPVTPVAQPSSGIGQPTVLTEDVTVPENGSPQVEGASSPVAAPSDADLMGLDSSAITEPVATRRDISPTVDSVDTSQPAFDPNNSVQAVHPTDGPTAINSLLNPPISAPQPLPTPPKSQLPQISGAVVPATRPAPENSQNSQNSQETQSEAFPISSQTSPKSELPQISPAIAPATGPVPAVSQLSQLSQETKSELFSTTSQSHTLVPSSVDSQVPATSAAVLKSQLSTVQPAIPARYASGETSFITEDSLSSQSTLASSQAKPMPNAQPVEVGIGRQRLDSSTQSLFKGAVAQKSVRHASVFPAATQPAQDLSEPLPNSDGGNTGNNRNDHLDSLKISSNNPSQALGVQPETRKRVLHESTIPPPPSPLSPNLTVAKSLLTAAASAAERRTADSVLTIDITIGQIEIRAVTPSAPKPKSKARKQRPGLSLEQYLNQRNQG